MGCFMYQYPKQILTIAQQVQSYIDAGMVITSREDVEKALKAVGFYRLRGYSFQLYDNAAKKSNAPKSTGIAANHQRGAYLTF